MISEIAESNRLRECLFAEPGTALCVLADILYDIYGRMGPGDSIEYSTSKQLFQVTRHEVTGLAQLFRHSGMSAEIAVDARERGASLLMNGELIRNP